MTYKSTAYPGRTVTDINLEELRAIEDLATQLETAIVNAEQHNLLTVSYTIKLEIADRNGAVLGTLDVDPEREWAFIPGQAPTDAVDDTPAEVQEILGTPRPLTDPPVRGDRARIRVTDVTGIPAEQLGSEGEAEYEGGEFNYGDEWVYPAAGTHFYVKSDQAEVLEWL